MKYDKGSITTPTPTNATQRKTTVQRQNIESIASAGTSYVLPYAGIDTETKQILKHSVTAGK